MSVKANKAMHRKFIPRLGLHHAFGIVAQTKTLHKFSVMAALDYEERSIVNRNIFKISVISLFALLAGCDDDKDNPSQTEFEQNYASWKSSKVSSYIYNYEAKGFTPLRGVWEIQIEQSETIHVTYLGSDTPDINLTVDSAPSIDSLYEEIQNCIDGSDTEVTKLTFDDESFIPIEYLCSNPSEGFGFNVSEFQQL